MSTAEACREFYEQMKPLFALRAAAAARIPVGYVIDGQSLGPVFPKCFDELQKHIDDAAMIVMSNLEKRIRDRYEQTNRAEDRKGHMLQAAANAGLLGTSTQSCDA